jgi:hypothetical protein
MSLIKMHRMVYMVNLALLFTHEIDSAYWQEWNLFGLPGGIQLFLILNLILLLITLYGFSALMNNQRSGFVIAMILSLSGLFAFSIHSYFIVTGHSEFTLPASETLLLFILLVSLIQGILIAFIYKEKNKQSA